jgi:uncharacterized protein (TIGR02145 family)
VAQCEACVLKQIHDKLHAAEKRPIRTKHAETLYAEFSDFFATSDDRDTPCIPTKISTENSEATMEEWVLPVMHHTSDKNPANAYKETYRLSENVRDDVHPLSSGNRSSLLHTANRGVIDAITFSDDRRAVPDNDNGCEPAPFDSRTSETQLIIADIYHAPSIVGEEKKHIKIAETVTDADGNRYTTVTIGKQVWTVENLKTRRFNDGTQIPLVKDAHEWTNLTTPGYCFFNNDTNTGEKFGALYNWFAVNSGKIAPQGWHVPNTAEWNNLVRYLCDHGYNWDGSSKEDKIAKSLAAKTCWNPTRKPGTIGNDLSRNNGSGFSALPAGFRSHLGDFSSSGDIGSWWSATEDVAFYAYSRYLSSDCSTLFWDYHNMRCGFSVRVVKD